MISPVVALLSETAQSTIGPLLHPDAEASGGMGLHREVNARTEQEPAAESQDRRQLFVGHWDCVGTKWSKDQGESPYYGHLRNVWALDRTWLVIHFKEYNPKEGQQPFAEDQYWGYTQNPLKQTRPIMTNANDYGILTAHEWEGDTLNWTGTYEAPGFTFGLTEKIVMLEQNKVRWSGEILVDTEVVASYDLVCTRQNQSDTADPAA